MEWSRIHDLTRWAGVEGQKVLSEGIQEMAKEPQAVLSPSFSPQEIARESLGIHEAITMLAISTRTPEGPSC